VLVTQGLERSLHRARPAPATAAVRDDLCVLAAVHRGKSSAVIRESNGISVDTGTQIEPRRLSYRIELVFLYCWQPMLLCVLATLLYLNAAC
jgi:hypothetical protein